MPLPPLALLLYYPLALLLYCPLALLLYCSLAGRASPPPAALGRGRLRYGQGGAQGSCREAAGTLRGRSLGLGLRLGPGLHLHCPSCLLLPVPATPGCVLWQQVPMTVIGRPVMELLSLGPLGWATSHTPMSYCLMGCRPRCDLLYRPL